MKLFKKISLAILIIFVGLITVKAQYKDYRVKNIVVVTRYPDIAKTSNPDILDTISFLYNYENGKLSQIIAEPKRKDNNLFPDNKKITFSYNKNIIVSKTLSGKLFKEYEFNNNNNLIRFFAAHDEYTMKYKDGKLASLKIDDQYDKLTNNYQYKYDKDNLIAIEEKSSLYTRLFNYENQLCTGNKWVFKDDTTDAKEQYRIERINGRLSKITFNRFERPKTNDPKVKSIETPISSTETIYDNESKIIKEIFRLYENNQWKIKNTYLIEYEKEVGNDSLLFLFNNWKINSFFGQRTYIDYFQLRY